MIAMGAWLGKATPTQVCVIVFCYCMQCAASAVRSRLWCPVRSSDVHVPADAVAFVYAGHPIRHGAADGVHCLRGVRPPLHLRRMSFRGAHLSVSALVFIQMHPSPTTAQTSSLYDVTATSSPRHH